MLKAWLHHPNMLPLRGEWQTTEQMKNILWLERYDIVM